MFNRKNKKYVNAGSGGRIINTAEHVTDNTEETAISATEAVEAVNAGTVANAAEGGNIPAPETPAKPPLKQRMVAYIKGSPKRYFITAFTGLAFGLFCTLIAGTIIGNIARIFGNWAPSVYDFLIQISNLAKVLMGAGIGAGIAYYLKAPKMVVFSAIVAGFIGAYASVTDAFGVVYVIGNPDYTGVFAAAIGKGLPGNPINSYLCALVAAELGILVSGKTKLDILVVPLTCIVAAGLIAVTLGRPVDWFVRVLSNGIKAAMNVKGLDFLMSIVIAVAMGLFLTLPTSSAAIGTMAGLSGIAAGAAVAGCCSHMVGFAVASFRENRWSGLVSQGLGTSMLQIPNVMRKPQLLVPAVAASAVTGPLAALVFNLHCDKAGSGMGTSGLVGVINTIFESLDNGVEVWKIAAGIILCCFVLPAAVAFLVSELMRKFGWIKKGDLKIEG